MGAAIIGWGGVLPDEVVTNAQLEARLDTTDAWISERTGIKERRVGGTTSVLAAAAGQAALTSAGLAPTEIDYVLVCTSTPDQAMPATASTVQHALGIPAGASDLNAACSGFVYGLIHSVGLLGMGMRRILLIGADALSRITDWSDRNTAVLFGDGAGAVVVESRDGDGGLLGWDLGSDGSAASLLYADIGATIVMDGREIFRRAVRAMVDSTERTLTQAGVRAEDVSLLVPHQANIRIIEAASPRLGIPMERTASIIHSTGNTSAASIPLALVDSVERGRLADGDLVLFLGFGAGMTWASALMEWRSGGAA